MRSLKWCHAPFLRGGGGGMGGDGCGGFGPGGGDGGPDPPWAERVDADAAGSEVQGHAASQLVHGPFRRIAGPAIGLSDVGRDARDADLPGSPRINGFRLRLHAQSTIATRGRRHHPDP